MRLSHFIAVLSTALASAAASPPAFHETLTLHPLPDGKLSVLFEFTTHFDLHHEAAGKTPQRHHSLTPPTLLLPLEANHVSELTVSFTSGQWHQDRYGESGPLQYEAGGGGGEIRGWIVEQEDQAATDDAWDAVTHALGGLFCASVGAADPGEVVRTFGDLYPPASSAKNLTHYLVSTPHLHLCTENLTPFLSLLPSKGLSGLSALLAQPGVVLAWGFKTEGIDVVMPTETRQGTWTGWWEGIVDLVPLHGGARSFSVSSIFKKPIGRPFAHAASSRLRVIAPEGDNFRAEPAPTSLDSEWLDGKARPVSEWDLLASPQSDVRFWWDNEGDFVHPQHIAPPPVTVSRIAADRHASDATFLIDLTNNAAVDRSAVYSEIWPWWVKGWLSEMTVKVDGVARDDLVHGLSYYPSVPPTPSTTSLHLNLTLPAHSTVTISIPFTKLTLKYTDHWPDAERGREIPASVLTLLDLVGEPDGAAFGTNVRNSARTRVYGAKLLLDVPTPDFSMPYNVIIMTSTVMAVFFGSIQGRLVRRWGWVKADDKIKKE